MNAHSQRTGAQSASPFLTVGNVTKSFGGAQALKGVSFGLRAGEVHGLVGANGAGKSTIIKILAGLVEPDGGEIRIDGSPVAIDSPHEATALGLSFIHQELAFVPRMTVLENITLGLPKPSRFGLIDWKPMRREVAAITSRVGLTAPLDADVESLSTAENWLINIARALLRRSRLIVMDEPTASLSESESEKLFAIIRDLSSSGVAVLYVSHRLDEILDLCHRVTVFRDGDSVAEIPREALTRPALVEAIVGGSVAAAESARHEPPAGAVVLAVDRLSRAPKVHEASFELHRGEVLGIGGLVGAGRSELVRLIFGVDRPDSGTMTLEGRPYGPRKPSDAVKCRIGFVPEERRSEGLVLRKSIAFNIGLSNLDTIVFSPALPLISNGKSAALAGRIIRDLAIKAGGPDTPVGDLSGGNQQKVVIGRWLHSAPKILILDEPTRGVDIGARSEIHRVIRSLAANGMSVLVVSSEPDELPELCDRVVVMVEGRTVRTLEGTAVTRANIVQASYAHQGNAT